MNINIRTDSTTKDAAEKIFKELGLSMSSAINIFLRQTVRENGMPFDLKLDQPNQTTIAAIEEGRKLAADPKAKKYSNMEELKSALES